MTTKTTLLAATLTMILGATAQAECIKLLDDWFDNGNVATGSPNDINPGFTQFWDFAPGVISEPSGFSHIQVTTAPVNSNSSYIVSNQVVSAPANTTKLQALWDVGTFTSNPLAINRMEFSIQTGFDFRNSVIAQPLIVFQIQEIPGTGTFTPNIRWETGGSFGTYTGGTPIMDLADYSEGYEVSMMMDSSSIMFTVTDKDANPVSPITTTYAFGGGDPAVFSDFASGGPLHIGGGIQSGANSPATITFENIFLKAVVVPEPSGLALLLLGLPFILRRRRR